MPVRAVVSVQIRDCALTYERWCGEMQIITVYKVHSKQALKDKIEELREQGKHPFSVARTIGDDSDWHGNPTYLLDPPIGYSTRSEDAVKPYMDQYHVIDMAGDD